MGHSSMEGWNQADMDVSGGICANLDAGMTIIWHFHVVRVERKLMNQFVPNLWLSAVPLPDPICYSRSSILGFCSGGGLGALWMYQVNPDWGSQPGFSTCAR